MGFFGWTITILRISILLKVKFFTSLSLSKIPPNSPISINGSNVSPVNSINTLGLNIGSKLSALETSYHNGGSKKLSIQFKLREFMFFRTVTPIIQESYPVLHGLLFSLFSGSILLLNRLESKANCLLLPHSLDLLSLQLNVGVFSLFYRYYNNRCSR